MEKKRNSRNERHPRGVVSESLLAGGTPMVCRNGIKGKGNSRSEKNLESANYKTGN